MSFPIRPKKSVETPLETAYKKQIERYTKDKNSPLPNAATAQLRSFPLVEDTVSLSSNQPDTFQGNAQSISADPAVNSNQEIKPSEPVTTDEKRELGTLVSIHV